MLPVDDLSQPVVRVLIVDDLVVIAEALHRALAAVPGIEVVGIGRSQADVSHHVTRATPDVILVHENFENFSGPDENLSGQILSDHPDIPVVAMVSDLTDERLYGSVSAGLSGLVRLRQDGFDVLVVTLRQAAAGEVTLSPAMLRRIIQRQRVQLQRDRQRVAVLCRLTRRELEVLALVAKGLENRAIADRMHVSVTTVRSHVQRVLSKLGVHSKLAAMVLATQYDLAQVLQAGAEW